ncbi:major facilitator superfamily transporter [Crucibulum laeve]|uniref:Major facilitator superfamily transporter n=1 Tax=Crucibulum laeve TaxID=68775 RepID=A0A5C3LU05_9AGAR|nr:major facilitator superfamily transporter [Crucibulum laeve]
MSDTHGSVDEETPLLDRSQQLRKPNPLPKLQIAILLGLQICEPIASQSIYPYINQLISELDITGGDERKVGYYAGLIESLFFVTEALTVLQWSRVSDHIGRKPVILIGLIGSSISMLCFGLSRTFWALVVSRCLCGLLNGNIGVMKSVMGELTDSTNRAEGFSLMPVTWAAGATIGPLMGGSLARPHERFPKVFSGSFWKSYPYFLPCLVAASAILIAFLVTACLFKETVKKRTGHKARASESSSITLVDSNENDSNKPLPLRKLLVYPVVISVANYVVLAFLNIAVNCLLPLFFTMPIEIGGLGFSPPTIGYILGAYGAGTGFYQAFYFSKIIRHFGERRIFVLGIASYIPVFMIFPLMSLTAQKSGITSTVWILLVFMLCLMAFMDMAYGCIFMYVTASSPNKRSLGATNGLSQSTVSVARAIGPAMATSLFSFSVQRNILGGYGVYALFACLSCFAVVLATRLPAQVWEEHEDESSRDD